MAKRKITREELVEIRKREMARKEMEQDLVRHLKSEEKVHESNARKTKDANPWIVALIKFLTSLIVLEFAIYSLSFFLPIFMLLYSYGHIMIILAALIPVVVPEHRFNAWFEGILRKMGYL